MIDLDRAKPGYMIVFRHPDYGREFDREQVKNLGLQVGREYEVVELMIDAYWSKVRVKWHDTSWLNTIHFDDAHLSDTELLNRYQKAIEDGAFRIDDIGRIPTPWSEWSWYDRRGAPGHKGWIKVADLRTCMEELLKSKGLIDDD